MLKNLKLGSRTVGGFVIVLVLLAVVAYVGYSGLTGVADRVQIADDVNRLIKQMLHSRQQEKNFIIRGDREYVDKVHKDVVDLKKLANETKDKLKDPANKQQMDDVLAAVGQYEKAFANYVDLHAQIDSADAIMVKSARELQTVADVIRQEQKAQYLKMRDSGAEADALADRLTKADDANRIIKWSLECRQQEKNFLMRGDKKYAEAVGKLDEEIVTLAKDIKSRFNQAHNKEQADKIIESAHAYMKAFDEVVRLKGTQEEADSAMVAGARATQEGCDKARANQKAKMEAQMATATRTMFGGAIVAILLGLGFAFMISKSISGGIAKVVGNIKQVADDASNGKLDSRADVEAVGVDFKAIPAGFNNTLDAVIGPLNVAAEYVDRISKGDIPESITDEYKGDFNEIKNNLNVCIEAINGLTGEAGMLAEAAIEGKLDTRGDADKFGGDFGKIVKGVNDTLDAVIGPLNVAAEYVDRISKGDIPESITDEYKGDFNEIKNNLNVCIDAINGLTAEAGMLKDAAIEGKLDTRGDAAKFGGDFGKIVQGVNDTLDAVIGPLNVAAEYVDRISKGDIPEKITDEYKGDFNEVKNNLNQCIEAINGLTGEAGMLTEAAIEGKLDTRGDAAKFGGDFGKIVQGVNDTLDAIVVPINEAMQVLGRVADRDLTKQVVGDYKGQLADFKENINAAVKNLHDALGQAALAADQVGSASGQIAGSSQQLAEGSGEQASSLEETSSSLEQMASMTKQNADNANQANTLMQEANQVIGKANTSMGDLTTSMDEISKASEETSKIIKTIDEIAFQTNLLALNAAVEAARAGEAGAGFAVVADEVRNLAMRAADAAKNTSDMIEGTVKKVAGGGEIVTKTNEAFTEVATSASKVGELVGEIAAASQEQTQGIEQVKEAVAEMDKVTQQNAANAEESASASEEMSAQAQELNSMLAEFKLQTGGRKQITTAAPKQEVKKVEKVGDVQKKERDAKPEAVIPMKGDKKAEDEDADFKDF